MSMLTPNTKTQLCAVIGDPVSHSLSPAIHNAAFAEAGINYAYLAFHVTDLPGCLAGMRALPSFRGMSVTIPHKESIIPLLDEVDSLAAAVGSVNTVTNDGGRLIGSTTDGLGTLRAFADADVSLDGKRVLFLGAGGAVRAVAFAVLRQTRAANVTILARRSDRAESLVSDLDDASRTAAGSLDDVEDAMRNHDVVIQGTPVGMAPDVDRSPVSRESFRPDQVVFDMVYRPHETKFLQDAQAAGCRVVYGIEMLLHQAALQFETWTGETAPLNAMRSAVKELI
jgi:shikimate dehydrogenase